MESQKSETIFWLKCRYFSYLITEITRDLSFGAKHREVFTNICFSLGLVFMKIDCIINKKRKDSNNSRISLSCLRILQICA